MKVFLDCMIYLHYRPIEELDLLSLLNVDNITIVIPRLTLRELDKQKNTHQSSKVRDRARRILKKIEQWMAGKVSVRNGVSVEFFLIVPTADYEKLGLNPQWSDDILIATILEYQRIHNDEKIILFTQDSGPRLTAGQLGIPVAELPVEMKLPEEPDPLEVKNRELSRTIERIQNALPQLTVCFAGVDDQNTQARFSFCRPPDTMGDEITSKIAALRYELPKQYPPKAKTPDPNDPMAALRAQCLTMGFLNPIEPEEYERYNCAIDVYLERYEQYIRETWEHKAALQRTIHFQIEIRNTGTAPANDIDVQIHFPDGFTLMEENGLPQLPKEPSPPRKPQTQMQKITDGVSFNPHLSFLSPANANFKTLSSFNIERTGSYTVTDHFARIKHGESVKMPEMFLAFDSFESAGSFHCEYIIRPANLPDPVRGKLHFVIAKEDADNFLDSSSDPPGGSMSGQK